MSSSNYATPEFQTTLPTSSLLGVIPFRARWIGINPTKATRSSIDTMHQLVGSDLMLPHILESDVFKNATNLRVSPTDLGQPALEYSIQVVAEKLAPTLPKQYTNLIP